MIFQIPIHLNANCKYMTYLVTLEQKTTFDYNSPITIERNEVADIEKTRMSARRYPDVSMKILGGSEYHYGS